MMATINVQSLQSSNYFVRLITGSLMDLNKAIPLFPFIPAVILFLIKSQYNHELLALRQKFDKEYDYIVIGAGTAGSVMAARLSEDDTKTVLLIEAGGSENVISDIPLMTGSLLHTPMDWAFLTQPQTKSAEGLFNRMSHWPRGKAVGGSSAINEMLYVRGNPRDYDKWAEDGADGWSWKDLFPYFVKSEDNRDPNYVESGYHGTGGSVTVSTATSPTPLAKAFRDSGPFLNYASQDFNAANQSSFDIPQRTVRDGQRCSMATAYLQPVIDRKNLHVIARSEVTKILFSGDDKRAIGVEFKRRFLTHVVYAKSEVILSAGPINSPKLLMLSGIGNRAHLETHGIALIADLPVGDNLQDHVSSGLHFTVSESTSLGILDTSPMRLLEYYVTKNNTLTSNLVEGVSFVKTKYTDTSDDWPDIQMHFTPVSYVSDFGFRSYKLQGINSKVWQKVFKPYVGRDTFSIYVTLLRPKTRGTVRLKSKRVFDRPLIDPNYFDDDSDLSTLVEGMRIASTIGSTPPFQRFNAQLFQTVFPGCENHVLYSDTYLRCLAKAYTLTNYDPIGTCKMGADSDDTAVVDTQLRVRGVKGVRVVDSSVIPTLISGNVNAITVVIAEKIADVIKGRRLKPLLPPMTKEVIESLPDSLEYEQISL